jgi:hypothetical protein
MKLTKSEKWLLFTFIVSLVHHIDHILRIDHSGWPLLPRVSPFTYSLFVYPIFLIIALSRTKSWYRVIGTSVLFLFATISHIFFEPMKDKFHTWAYGSNLKYHIGEQNMLGYNSKFLGVCSIALAILLSLSLLVTLVLFIKEARLNSLHIYKPKLNSL